MAVVQERLSPAQVADACRLYVRRKHVAKNMPVPDESILLGESDVHTMKGSEPVSPDVYDYVMVSYTV